MKLQEVSLMKKEIMVPGVDLPVTKEVLYDSVRDTYRNIKGILALQQQFYFSSLNIFRTVTTTDEESMIKMIALHPEKEELKERLSLAGVTLLDIIVSPGTVEVKYPKYDSHLEYRDVSMYNTVYIENPPEDLVKILRIIKEGGSDSELFLVRKKDSWSMKEWPEVLLYSDKDLFEERINKLLKFFGILREDFDYALSSFDECESSNFAIV
jgi:hypothetical protein